MGLGEKTEQTIGVLLVDDLPLMRTELRKIVTAAGHIVVAEAANGGEAFDYYTSRRPDVVLLDIVMPVMDGLSALKRIIRYDKGARVIMCSSLGQQKYLIRAIQSGARDFIVKPFTEERVVSAIEKAVLR